MKYANYTLLKHSISLKRNCNKLVIVCHIFSSARTTNTRRTFDMTQVYPIIKLQKFETYFNRNDTTAKINLVFSFYFRFKARKEDCSCSVAPIGKILGEPLSRKL